MVPLNERTWRIVQLVATLLAWAYVAARAARVPWVHDECASLFWYVERGEWLPGLAHWDANNHVLGTLIGLLSYKLFGLDLFASRIGSVLAFGVYACAAWRMAERVKDDLSRNVLLAALLLCPFALDFFALFRGYGLQLAFWMVAIDGALRYAEADRTRHLLLLTLGLLLANAAVLALVPLWGIVVALVMLHVAWRWRKLTGVQRLHRALIVALLGVVPLCAAAWVAWQLKDRGLLYHGTLDGFVKVTLTSLAHYVLGTTSPVIMWTVLALMAAALAVGMRTKRRELVVVAGLFWLDAVARIALARLAGVNYPEDRAALHLVPLIILAIALLFDTLARAQQTWRWAVLLLLVLPIRSLVLANTSYTLLWPEQSVPPAFAERIASASMDLQRPVVVGAYHQMNMTIPYALRLAGRDPVVPHAEGFPLGAHDLRLVDERFLRDPMPGYRAIEASPANGCFLLQREDAFNPEPIAERRFADGTLANEFFDLVRLDTLGEEGEVWIEVSAQLLGRGYADLHLVVQQDAEGTMPPYRDDVALALLRPVWSGERLHLFRPLRLRASSTAQVVYFWNVRGNAVAYRDLVVRVHRLPQLN